MATKPESTSLVRVTPVAVVPRAPMPLVATAPDWSEVHETLLREARIYLLGVDVSEPEAERCERHLQAVRALEPRTLETERKLVRAETELMVRTRRAAILRRAPIPCTVCGGEGVLPIPVCHHGFECGSGCGGSICGDIDEPCGHCAGSGKEPCVDCGEPAHLIHKGDAVCVRCLKSEVG